MDKELEDQPSDNPKSPHQKNLNQIWDKSNYKMLQPAGILPMKRKMPQMLSSLTYLTPAILNSNEKLFFISYSIDQSLHKEWKLVQSQKVWYLDLFKP